MQFTLTITCDNAAFGDTNSDRVAELANILAKTAHRLQDVELFFRGEILLFDSNGNTVGTARIIED